MTKRLFRYVSQRTWPMALTMSIAGGILIFILPLYVPIKPLQSISASYLAGFDNAVAIRSATSLSLIVYLWALWRRQRTQPRPRCEKLAAPLARRFVVWLVLANAGVLVFCGSLVMASGTRYLGDAGYIIEQAGVLRNTGRPLYTGIEFAYGPLLIWPEVWVSRLFRCSMPMAYFTTLIVESSLGLLILAYVLNQIPARNSLRRWTLGLFVLAALTPHLGVNYTFLRFASPLAFLLFSTKSNELWRCALWLTAGVIIELMISPELALVLALGAVTFALLRALQDGARWLLTAVLPLSALVILLKTAGHSYLQMASSFTRGALNLPVGPYPHVLILLLALIWIVPVGLGTSISWRRAEDARLLALFATSLAFTQAALGRCDPVHIIFNGVGIFALSLLYFSHSSRKLRYAWVATLAILVLWSQFVTQRFFQMRTADVLARTVMPHLSVPLQRLVTKVAARRSAVLGDALSSTNQPDVDLASLASLAGSSCIATPLDIAPRVEEELQKSHRYHPGLYAFWVDMMNAKGEQRSIEDVNQCAWMLLPQLSPENPHTPANLAALQGLTLPYKMVHSPLYEPGVLFRRELEQHWTRVATVGSYSLMQRATEPRVESVAATPESISQPPSR